MASEIWLTDGVVRVLTLGTKQSLAQSVDVGAFDQLDLLLWVNGFEGTPGNLTVDVITGMSMDSEDGWWTLGSFTATSAVNAVEKKTFTGLLRYVRWKTTLATATSAMFNVRGMARSN